MPNPRIGIEGFQYYNFEAIHDVGVLKVTGAGAGTYTADEDLPGAGSKVYARVDDNAIGETEIVLTIAGTPSGGTVTIPAYAQEGQGYLIKDSYGNEITYTEITGVTFTGGTAGESVELTYLPVTSFTLLGYDQGFNYDPGATSRPIPEHYEAVACWKKIRGEHTFSISQLYQTFSTSLTYLRGRDFTFKVEVHEDNASTVSEYIYFGLARIATNPNTWPGDDTDVTVSGDGNYQKLLVTTE